MEIKIIEDLSKNCFACTEAEYHEDLAATAPWPGACRAAENYYRRYREAKLEAKALDFSDFEHLSLSLLADETAKEAIDGRAG